MRFRRSGPSNGNCSHDSARAVRVSKAKRSMIAGKQVTKRVALPAGGMHIETFVPWTLVKHKVRREVVTPIEAPVVFREELRREKQQREREQHSPLIRVLGLAHCWRQLLDITAISGRSPRLRRPNVWLWGGRVECCGWRNCRRRLRQPLLRQGPRGLPSELRSAAASAWSGIFNVQRIWAHAGVKSSGRRCYLECPLTRTCGGRTLQRPIVRHSAPAYCRRAALLRPRRGRSAARG